MKTILYPLTRAHLVCKGAAAATAIKALKQVSAPENVLEFIKEDAALAPLTLYRVETIGDFAIEVDLAKNGKAKFTIEKIFVVDAAEEFESEILEEARAFVHSKRENTTFCPAGNSKVLVDGNVVNTKYNPKAVGPKVIATYMSNGNERGYTVE